MIGLRVLPALRPDPETGVEMFACGPCRTPGRAGWTDEATRRVWHCGWMDPVEWLPAELPPRFGDVDYMVPHLDAETGAVVERPVDVCPGYFKSSDAAREADLACAALRHGELFRYFPDGQNPIIEAAMTLDAAQNGWEAYQMREATKKNNG